MNRSFYILTLFFWGATMASFANPSTVENTDVPPKEEWRVCIIDDDCVSRIVDCGGFGDDISYNKKFIADDSLYFAEKCREKIKNGAVKVFMSRKGPRPRSECIKQKCEVVLEKPMEEQPSYFERLKSWFNDLF